MSRIFFAPSKYVQGAGIQAAQTVIGRGAEALITGFCGPKAFRVLTAAKVQVLTGTHSHGQGHETTFSQLVADKLPQKRRVNGSAVGSLWVGSDDCHHH